ncbi:unnamed protein product, partial [Mesorhabditis belari]|uniref:Haloacid dehalogenase-like hydrolase domain-containing protein 3 n=1 Tax=Mesorhabditis belari TaxID=2138241 RepID=A0AAF3J5B0_9BILA
MEWWGKVIKRTIFENPPCTSNDRISEMCKALFAHYENPAEWKIVDEETIPILERLRLKGIHTAVISNFDFRLKKLLDDFHLSSLLELVVLSGEVGIEKPNSRIFELVTDHFHLKSPKHLLHIGDHLQKDFHGARNFGAKSLLFDPKNRQNDSEFSPAEKITKIAEILTHVE